MKIQRKLRDASKKAESYSRAVVRFLDSNWFLYAIIGLFVVQALWIAFSFRYPMIYDEGTHLSFIRAYSDDIFPYTTDTPGNMTTQISIFHYTMSLVFRLIEPLFSDTAVIIILRVIGVFMVAAGLLVYSRLLRVMGISRVVTNVALLIFVLLPITPFVAATINYDNLLFLGAAIYLLMAAEIIRAKTIDAKSLIKLLIVGCLVSLVKYTFLPILVASLVYIVFHLWFKYRKKTITHFLDSLKRLDRKLRLNLAIALAIVTVAFMGVYALNVVLYRSIVPRCAQTQSEQKCERNGIIQRNAKALETVDQRSTVPITNYTYAIWFNSMLKTTNWSGNYTDEGRFKFAGSLPTMDKLLFLGVIIGAAISLYMWRALSLNSAAIFAVTMALALIATVYWINASSYYRLHEAYAIQPRYLLIIVPILLGIVVHATSAMLTKHRTAKVVALAVILLLFTQGGGSLTHILRSDPSWYWPSEPVLIINEKAKTVLSPLIKE